MRLTDRGRVALWAVVALLAFLIGVTAEWWDPWASGAWSP